MRFLLCAISVVLVCPTVHADDKAIIVSAASSLTDVLQALKPAAEAYVGASVMFNFGASGALRKQIEEGAPADVFFSAAVQDMDQLDKAGLVDRSTRRNVLTNSMVLVSADPLSPAASPAEVLALIKGAKVLAVGNPETVPAGRYAIQALKSGGWLTAAEGKMVYGSNVRDVLQFVRSGSAPLGIVFGTDAKSAAAAGTTLVYRLPDSLLETPVFYPAAAVASTRNPALAGRFLAFLSTPEAKAAFAKAGFGAP